MQLPHSTICLYLYVYFVPIWIGFSFLCLSFYIMLQYFLVLFYVDIHPYIKQKQWRKPLLYCSSWLWHYLFTHWILKSILTLQLVLVIFGFSTTQPSVYNMLKIGFFLGIYSWCKCAPFIWIFCKQQTCLVVNSLHWFSVLLSVCLCRYRSTICILYICFIGGYGV